ncbi:hypothetical protein GLOTRDRAFT_139095 [Gloeophyllum trabeum ATCC 11539]|uniref:Aprataxin and PNK-like factor PBZ domain-containing protein n=1 Tax=Gloeophyllum trabeum (strain ATCC 11539 / FP-39264 / Madison 617) TaxID=670483 RepID=S7RP15_GLOTA|nr:uncharacterized protein GLOTRDRAFT_139095 [Gloeophyllum trabeum ATCC 11539]EPQ54519.1 hypothetical protein GLOTRDRAFT_139095 [Gloeophyllum trabeum ATCC 11539]
MSGTRDSFPVADDLVDCIMRALPDLSSLSSVILVSKHIYEVFKCHPSSIVSAVAYNHIGPALPQALRAARHDKDRDTRDPSNWVPESEVLNTPITRSEAQTLNQDARVVSELEDLFSWSHKDPTSPKSVLSENESMRFCRAMYRFLLYADTFRCDEEEDEDEDEDGDLVLLNYTEEKERFFDSLGDDTQFLEFAVIYRFLCETVQWTARAIGEFYPEWTGDNPEVDMLGFVVSTGPEVVLQMFKCQSGAPFIPVPENEENLEEFCFIARDLAKAFERRRLGKPDWNLHEMKKVILDDYYKYEDHPCDNCKQASQRLWSSANWPLLKGILSPGELGAAMKGHLPRNFTERQPLTQYLERPAFCYPDLFKWMIEHNTELDGGQPLTPDNWLCEGCLRLLVRSKMHEWWLERKRAEGIAVPAENCWYGYNCRTQAHRPQHASKLNHLCEPIRGDPA